MLGHNVKMAYLLTKFRAQAFTNILLTFRQIFLNKTLAAQIEQFRDTTSTEIRNKNSIQNSVTKILLTEMGFREQDFSDRVIFLTHCGQCVKKKQAMKKNIVHPLSIFISLVFASVQLTAGHAGELGLEFRSVVCFVFNQELLTDINQALLTLRCVDG